MRLLAVACAALAAIAAGAARGADTQGVVGSVRANPLSVQLTLPTDPVKRGKWFSITALVTNSGPVRLDKVTATLVHPTGLLLDRTDAQGILFVPALGSKTAKWEACSNAAGSYVVLARAAVSSYVAESLAGVVQIVPSSKTC
jgi:hypothetical protein